MTYEVTDITKQTYELLKKKRESAMKYRTLFEDEGYSQWFDMLIGQTEYINVPFEQFKEKMARYIYVIRKQKNPNLQGSETFSSTMCLIY